MEFLEIAVLSFLNYLPYFSFIALPCKAGNKTIYLLFTSIDAQKLVEGEALKALWKLDGTQLRWKGLMVDKVKRLHLPKPALELTIDKRWDEFKYESGNRSKDQERTVTSALNAREWLGQSWEMVSMNANKVDEYNPDIQATNGLTVEVKGFNSPVFKH